MVKIIVVNKTKPHFLEMVHSKIMAVGVHDVQIVEDTNLVLKETNSAVEQTTPETTLEIFNKYIQKIDSSNLNLDKLQTVMSNLYSRASSSE